MTGRGADRQRVRIIGGSHRGRIIRFPDEPGLRPTSDRVRETLFNWLQFDLPGARCLDPFAGSGVLGFEAVSRDAKWVVMIEQSTSVVKELKRNARALGLDDRVDILQCDALDWLAAGPPESPFDIVFVDPPFAADLVEVVIERLSMPGWLSPGASVYIEQGRKTPPLSLPESWEMVREKTAGDVSYCLVRIPE